MKKSFGSKTLIFPTPVWCVGSYDTQGNPNVMTIAWGGICCSSPPCVTISLRKATYTYGNIMERKAYTLSVPSEAHAAAADFFGIVSGRTEDKFARTGLTAVRSELVDPDVQAYHGVGQFVGKAFDIGKGLKKKS